MINRYCSFHLGNFKRAEEAYRELLDAHEVTNAVYLYIACCYFYQQMFEEAEKIAEKGITTSSHINHNPLCACNCPSRIAAS